MLAILFELVILKVYKRFKTEYVWMTGSGETAYAAPKGKSKNSQAKEPYPDKTPESHFIMAPTGQPF